MKLFAKRANEDAANEPGRRRVRTNDDLPASPNQSFSYYAQQRAADAQDGTPPGRKRGLKIGGGPIVFWAQHRALGGCLLLLAALAVGYLSYLSTSPRIILLSDQTTKYFLQDSQVYRQTVTGTLGSSPFNHSKLTLDTARVRRDLLQNYPEIKHVSVDVPLIGQQPRVYIEPYKPSFILTTTTSNAFVLDTTGRALATPSQITHIDKLGMYTVADKTGLSIKLGGRALPSSTVAFTQTVVKALSAEHAMPSTLALVSAYELDVTVQGTSYYVKYNLQEDALQQAGTHLATKQRLETDRITPAQYIDVRVPGRAYYK